MAGCALLVESSPGTGTTHPPHPALLRPSPCNPTSIRRQVLRLLYGSGTGSLSCLSFARAYFVVPLYQYMRKRETHHYLFVASFNAQTTKMLKNAYLLAKIGADTAENDRFFAENLPKIGNDPPGPVADAR